MSTNDATPLGRPSSRFGEINANIITSDGSFRRTIGGVADPQMRQQGESVAQNVDVAGRDTSQLDPASMIAPEGSAGGQEWTTAQSRAIGAAFGKNNFAEVKDFLAGHQALHMSDGVIMLRTKEGGEIAVFANGAMSIDGEMVRGGATVEGPEMVADLDLDTDTLDPEPDWFADSRQEVDFSDDQIRMLAALGGRNIDNIDQADREFVAQIAQDLHAHRLSEDGVVVIDLEPDATPGQPSDLEIPRSVAINADGTLVYGSAGPERSNVSLTDVQRGNHSPEIGEMRDHLDVMRGIAVDGPEADLRGAQQDITPGGVDPDEPQREFIGVVDLDGLDNSTDIGGPLVCNADGFRDMSTGEEYSYADPEDADQVRQCQTLVQEYLRQLQVEEPAEYERVMEEQRDMRAGEATRGIETGPEVKADDAYDLSMNR